MYSCTYLYPMRDLQQCSCGRREGTIRERKKEMVIRKMRFTYLCTYERSSACDLPSDIFTKSSPGSQMHNISSSSSFIPNYFLLLKGLMGLPLGLAGGGAPIWKSDAPPGPGLPNDWNAGCPGGGLKRLGVVVPPAAGASNLKGLLSDGVVSPNWN